MRPFDYFDRLDPRERAAIKRWHFTVIGIYSAVGLGLLAFIAGHGRVDAARLQATDTPPALEQVTLVKGAPSRH